MSKVIIEKNEIIRKSKSLVVTFRVFQAIFWGMFALGISMIGGDTTAYAKLPFSSFSITTTIFGFIGALLSGHFAKVSEDW